MNSCLLPALFWVREIKVPPALTPGEYLVTAVFPEGFAFPFVPVKPLAVLVIDHMIIVHWTGPEIKEFEWSADRKT